MYFDVIIGMGLLIIVPLSVLFLGLAIFRWLPQRTPDSVREKHHNAEPAPDEAGFPELGALLEALFDALAD